jgi:hypothetical protein
MNYRACQISPTEEVRRTLPRGDGQWKGFESVYRRLSAACERMGQVKYVHLSDEHVRSMAIMGCGHEETMKAEQHRLFGRGFLRYED